MNAAPSGQPSPHELVQRVAGLTAEFADLVSFEDMVDLDEDNRISVARRAMKAWHEVKGALMDLNLDLIRLGFMAAQSTSAERQNEADETARTARTVETVPEPMAFQPRGIARPAVPR